LNESSINRDGVVILEAFSENQLARSTGGPKDADMLMTVEKLQQKFLNLEPVLLREVEREVSEGAGHSGMASVVQFIGRKKGNGSLFTPFYKVGHLTSPQSHT